MSIEAIYREPAKAPLSLHNAEHQSFSQNIEGVEAVTRVYPLAGTTRAPHRALTEATESTIAQRPRKHSRILNDRELLVALHQKQDRHHDWLKRQMQSLRWMSTAFAILPPRMPLLPMKPVGVHGKG